MNNYIKKIRLFLYIFLLATVLFLLYKAAAPFGKITYALNPCASSFTVTKIKPVERVEDARRSTILGLPLLKCAQKITGDPVYFNVNTQRGFDKAKITLQYRLPEHKSALSAAEGALKTLNTPIIEMGILADERKNYYLKPLENKIIDELEWSAITENGLTLWQRRQDFSGIDEFLQSIPARDKVLSYHYDLPAPETIDNYSDYLASSRAFAGESVRPLRGPYRFYTYSGGEELYLNFTFTNLKKDDRDDVIKVIVYYNNSVARQEEIANEGTIALKLENPPAGFYKVAVETTDDVITDRIETTQNILSFINRLWLANTLEPELINLMTDSSEIFVRTANPNSLQKILVRDKVLKIDETYRQFSQVTNMPISDIRLAKDDVIIEGDGIFSFTNEAFYDPDYRKVNKNSDLDRQGIDYIITSYKQAASSNGWRTRTVEFDLTSGYRYKGAYGFIISIPGLKADDDAEDYLEIREIRVELQGKTLLEKIFNLQ